MASKTALPIARLRSLGCKVSTLLGHDVPSPVSGRYPGIRAVWKYGVTLPEGIEVPFDPETVSHNGTAYATIVRDGRVIVTGLDAEVLRDETTGRPRTPACAKLDREVAETDVAGLLNGIADALSKA